MADEEAKVAKDDRKEYVLRSGASIDTIEDGEAKSYSGDGKATIKLTEEQAQAFNDKLEGLADPEVANTANVSTVVVGQETGGRATMNEGAAAAKIDAEPGEDNPDSEVSDEELPRPSGQLRTPVKSAEEMAPKSGASSDAGGTKEPIGGKPAGPVSTPIDASKASGDKPSSPQRK